MGTFKLDHDEAIAGNCPNVSFDFEATDLAGVKSTYSVYVEHQDYSINNGTKDYAGIYLTGKNDVVSIGASSDDVKSGNINLNVKLDEQNYINCTGELE